MPATAVTTNEPHTTTLHSRSEASVLRLFCSDCNAPRWSCPHDQAELMSKHTMRVHHRRPTVDERTPVDTVAHLRVERLIRSWPEQLDQILGLGGRLVIDAAGRRWCMILAGFGITRHTITPAVGPQWCVAYLATVLRPIATLDEPGVVAALERWDAANPSPDHTLPAGIVRPTVSAFITRPVH